MNRIINLLHSLGKWPAILLLLAVFFGFNGFLFPWAEQKIAAFGGPDAKVLDLRFGFSADEAHQFLEQIGPEGRPFYQMLELTMDLVYPLVYSLLLGGLLMLVWRKLLPENSSWARLALIPIAAGVFDLLENAGITALIQSFPGNGGIFASLASLFGMGKWVCFGMGALLLIAGLITWGLRLLMTRK